VNGFEYGTELWEVITAETADVATTATGVDCEADHVFQSDCDCEAEGVHHCCDADDCQAPADAVAVASDKNGILLSTFCCGKAYPVEASAKAAAITFLLEGAIVVRM